MDGDRANSLLSTNWCVSCLLVLCFVCCSASGQRVLTADGLAYSVKPYTLLTVQAVGSEGILGTWPRVMRGDMILAINEVPVLSPEMLADQHFCSGPRSLLILRPWGNQYFQAVVHQPGCLFRFGRLVFMRKVRPLVTVEQVLPSSMAGCLGLQSGDIIYRVGPYSAFGTPQMISSRLAYGMAKGPFYVYAVRNGNMIQLTAPVPVAPAPPIVQTQQAPATQELAIKTSSTVEAQLLQPTVETPALHHYTLTLVNETPFIVSAAVHIAINADHERTDGWYTLQPGEKRQLSYSYANQPTFSVYGETVNADNVRWVHPKANPEATLYFEGAEDDQSCFHEISRTDVRHTRASPSGLSDRTAVTESVPFAPATVSASGESYFLFQDPYVAYLNDTSGISEDAALATILSRARQLGRAIERQRTFRLRFPSDKMLLTNWGL